MLPGGTDSLYRSVLAAPHRRYLRLEVWSGDGIQLSDQIPAHLQGDPEGGLAIVSGTVSATLTSRVARNLTFAVPIELYPRVDTDLLAPFGNEIRAFMGVRLGDGDTTYTWQVFRGRIKDVSMDSRSGTCVVVCSDRATDVADHGFLNPENSQPGNTINAEWQRLIVDAVPDATFGVSDTFDRNVAPLTWEFDRASGLDEMARSVGALWYPLANGDFVLRRFQWTVDQPLVFTLTDATGGTVNAFSARRLRTNIFNVVTVTGERLNGDTPVHATASNTTPGSPTNTSGPFGIRSRVDRLQTPMTQGGAQGTAEALLRAYIAPTEEWNLSVVPDAALELGDAGTLLLDDREVIQVVTAFTLPLDLTGDMTVSTRSLVLGGVV
jgi:hypothetical protein